MAATAGDAANRRLVEQLIALGALWSRPLVAAFRATPRHRFLDRVFHYQPETDRWQEIIVRDPGPEELRVVYADRALITHLSRDEPVRPLSSSSQPSLMAQMLEDLRPARGQRVLEVGAGTGYNAALLAHVAGPGQVLSLDVDANVLSEAWDHLRTFPERQVALKQADGRLGDPGAAPFDRIMVTAATPDLEAAWLGQLAAGGVLVGPVAFAPGLSYVVRGEARAGVFEGELTRPAYFLALRSEGESGPAEAGPGPTPGTGEVVAAPWAGWFDRRRPRANSAGFLLSLAFFAWLKRVPVGQEETGGGQVAFVLGEGQAVCRPDVRQWHVSGTGGKALAERLWRAFLDAGAPRPTDYRFRLPLHSGRSPGGDLRARATWEIREPRERAAWY
jgi:protein-L-isoaspartate(D-aspartate) O-methyltransferase